jgi:hypothetical protein
MSDNGDGGGSGGGGGGGGFGFWHVMSAVVSEPPPTLPTSVSPALRDLGRVCQTKEPAERASVDTV